MSPLVLWATAAFFAFLPALFWLGTWYRKSEIEMSSKTLVFRSFFYGALGVVPFLGIKYMLEHSPNLGLVWGAFQERWFFFSTVFLTFLLAGLEEFLKHFGIHSSGEDHRRDPQKALEGVLCFISAGIGFAFIENVIYFKDAMAAVGMHPLFWRIFIFRSFGTMLAHSLFSGVFGFLWVKAAFGLQKTTSKLSAVSK